MTDNTTRPRDSRGRRLGYRRRSSWVRFEFSWLLDHPVSAELTDRLLRAWLATVAGAVELDRADGSFRLDELEPYSTPGGRRRVTEADLERFRELGLVERVGEGWRVREWVAWSVSDSTAPLRGRLWRQRQREAREEAARTRARVERARAERAARQVADLVHPPDADPRPATAPVIATDTTVVALELPERDDPPVVELELPQRDEPPEPTGWPTWGQWADEEEPS
jgi:hypothetical protein